MHCGPKKGSYECIRGLWDQEAGHKGKTPMKEEKPEVGDAKEGRTMGQAMTEMAPQPVKARLKAFTCQD